MGQDFKIVGFAGSVVAPVAHPQPGRRPSPTPPPSASGAAASIYDLNEIHPSLGSTLDPRQAPPDLRRADRRDHAMPTR